ncbi:winged helix-turn-helix domain-containing protein [Aliikangiella sp. IMCC44653]
MYNPAIQSLTTGKMTFGKIEYDASNQRLSANGETVYLRNKLNEVLFYMMINKQRVISREELIQKVWHGNYYTGEKGVTHSVCKLRKTLQQMGVEEIQIKTFPKQGYAITVV